jgi:hypothetical protein
VTVSSGTGVAGLAVTGLVAALVALGASAMFTAGRTPPVPPAAPSKDSEADLRREVERLRREVEELRQRHSVIAATGIAAASRSADPAGAAPATGTGTAAEGAPPGSDAPLPANRGELVALIDERLAAKGVAAAVDATPPKKKMTIEQAGAELGLSSVDIDTTRRIWRDSENEMLVAFMGTADLEAIKEEVKAAAEDPDRKAALINRGVGNFVRNLGRIMTIEDRRNRELKKFLTEEQMKKLKGYDIQSTLNDPELEDVFNKVFDGNK